MRANRPTTCRALFRCNVPIRCQSSDRSAKASCLGSASCTRFSPISRSPAAKASRTTSGPWVLVTATIRTGWFHPPTCCRCCMVSRTAASRAGRPGKFIAAEFIGGERVIEGRLLRSFPAFPFFPPSLHPQLGQRRPERGVGSELHRAVESPDHFVALAPRIVGIGELGERQREG